MTLDELLKQNAAWLEQAAKQRMFAKVDDAAINFPEEQRQRRREAIEARIAALSQRKGEVAASYDRTIELEKQELKALSDEGVAVPKAVARKKPKKSKK
jgi:hypothetical protein